MRTAITKNRHHRLRPSRLLFLIILLASNTFAWFIYATRINSDVSVHVRAWNVVFEAGEHQVTDMVSLDVDSIYPGMDDYTYEIKAYNRSDVSASLSYQILNARILNQEFVTVEGREALGQEANPNDLTSDQLKQKLLNDYPFSISISTSNDTIALGNGEEIYTFAVVWPYESNHDDIDTMWGVNSYQYKESNPDSPSITLSVKIIITQNPS